MYSARTKETILILIFAIVAVASGADLLADFTHATNIDHLVKEAIVMSISIIAITWLLFGLHKQNLEITSLQQELDAVNSTRAKPRKYVLEARKNWVM